MIKYIRTLVDELKALKKGMTTHATIWNGMAVTEKQLQDAIDELEKQESDIEDAETLLIQQRTAGRNLVEKHMLLASQATNLALGLHPTDSKELLDYNIQPRKDSGKVPVPEKAVIASIEDDVDGEGFIINIQKLDYADVFDVEKGSGDNADSMVYTGKFTHLKNSKKISFVDDDVKRGVRYFYRVRGFNRNGYGEWSEPVSRVQ